MSTFGPHQIPASNWRAWVGDALALPAECWALTGGAVLLASAAMNVLPRSWPSPVLLGPILCGFACLVVCSADRSGALSQVLRASRPERVRIGRSIVEASHATSQQQGASNQPR